MSAASSPTGARFARRPRAPSLARMLTREGVTRSELAVYVAVLSVATFVLLFQHVIKSGFYSDDWAYRTAWVQVSSHGFWSGLSGFFQSSVLKGRPTLAVYLSLLEQALGSHQERYLAWAAVLAVIFSASVYVLLRTLRLRPLDAGLIGLLLLVFPGSDSTRIWAMISDAQVAMSLVLLGVTCSVASLNHVGRRAVGLRVGGIALMVLGVTTYELTFGALFMAFLLYRTRAPWRRVMREAAIDWVVLALVYVIVLSHSTAVHLPLSLAIDHGRTILNQTFTLFATIALPFHSSVSGAVVALLILLAAAVVYRLLPEADPTRAQLRRWLGTVGIAVVMVAGAYVIYAPSSPIYVPLAPGLLNRTNAFGALPIMVLIYSLAALMGLLLFRGLRHGSNRSALATVFIVVAIGAGYTASMTHDLKLWDSGWTRAQTTLLAFYHEVPPPPHESLIVFFGQPIEEAPDVPVWEHTWDLDGAIRLIYHDLTLRGRPAFPGTKIVCGRTAGTLTNTLYSGVTLPTDNAAYGYLYLFNSITGAVSVPRNQRQCQQAAPAFVPGPLLATDPGSRDPGL